MKTWYLGIHQPAWLANPRLADVPVFISRRTFLKRGSTTEYRDTFPRRASRGHYDAERHVLTQIIGGTAFDSGGFTELQRYGRWTSTATEYVAFLRRAWNEVGPFDFAAPMDWMCEPAVIKGGNFAGLHFVGTGLDLDEHLRRTVDNYLELKTLAPDLPIIPVLQGWRKADYHRCWDMYEAAGVDLTAKPIVGIGSVCRRQHMDEAADILDSLHDRGLRNMHGFGFKIQGLRACWEQLATADSMSWSLHGRHSPACPHTPYLTGKQPKNCANCLRFALEWRAQHIAPPRRARARQLELPAEWLGLFEEVAA